MTGGGGGGGGGGGAVLYVRGGSMARNISVLAGRNTDRRQRLG